MGGEFIELINLLRENLLSCQEAHGGENRHAVVDDGASQRNAERSPQQTDEKPLKNEDIHDRSRARPHRFQESDLLCLLYDRRDQSVGDAEGRDKHNEDQQKKLHVFLHLQHTENPSVNFLPGTHFAVGRLFQEGAIQIGKKGIHMERVIGPDIHFRGGTPGISEEFVGVFQIHEDHFPVEIVFPEAVDGADGIFARQIILGILRHLKFSVRIFFDQACETGGRMQQDSASRPQTVLIRYHGADRHLPALQMNKRFRIDNGFLKFDSPAPVFRIHADESLGREIVSGLKKHGRQDQRLRIAPQTLHDFNEFFRVLNQSASGRTEIVRSRPETFPDLSVCAGVEQLLLEMVCESSHDCEHHDQNGHAESDSDHRNERDHRNGAAFGFEIFPGQEKFRFQIHDDAFSVPFCSSQCFPGKSGRDTRPFRIIYIPFPYFHGGRVFLLFKRGYITCAMKKNPQKKLPELLAPAGNLACALAAFDAGADAVYAGLKRFNARERTENFSEEELSRLLAWAARNSKRVYITFNTLVKESELDEAAEILSRLEELRPDALIVQDLGILGLIREYFPKLTVHASTQMGLHNSAGLALAAKLGIRRVILERQIQLDELELMMARKPESVELEMFIHGALCCCISGTCLLSSWLGGWSGNRGKCKQPCRRRYHGEKGNGFFLSAQDLCTIEILPRILRSGVASLKIEGRLRRADYVSRVVSAYRMALDAAAEEDPAAFREVLPGARELLGKTCGRRWSLGFYTPESAAALMKHDAMGVSGLLSGKVTGVSGNGFHLHALRRLHVGDAIRIQPRSGDEGPAMLITKMTRAGLPVKRVLKGEDCFIHSDKEVPRDAFVYKTGESFADYTRRIAELPAFKPVLDLQIALSRSRISVDAGEGRFWEKTLSLEGASSQPLSAEWIVREFKDLYSEHFSFGQIHVSVEENPFLPASLFKSLRREFRDWLDALPPGSSSSRSAAGGAAGGADSLARFRRDYARILCHPRGAAGGSAASPLYTMLLSGSRHAAAEAAGGKKGMGVPPRKNCVIAREIKDHPSPSEELFLPFFVNENALDGVRRALERHFAAGGRRVRVTSLHHFALLEDFPEAVIRTALPLPVCNSMAVLELQSLGADMVQAWLELEKGELEKLIRKSSLPLEIYRYGRPALLSTRAVLAADGKISDARGNVFRVFREGILTRVYAEKVLSLPEMEGAGGYFFDLTHASSGETDTARFNFDFTFS